MAVIYQGHIVILLAIFPVTVIKKKYANKSNLMDKEFYFGLLFKKEAVCYGEYKLSW